MGKVIGVISIKGGVGKTTVASSLAADLRNRYGKNVLLVDANYSAPNLGLHMDIVEPEGTIHEVLSGKKKMSSVLHNRYGVDVVPGSYVQRERLNYLKLKDKLKNIKGNYDYVVLDSSPSLNEELLSTILASDALFVVSTPDYPTLSCSLRAAQLAKQRGRPIAGIVLNKVRDPKYELSISEIEQTTGIPVVAKIPDDKSNGRALFMRIPTSVYNAKSKFGKEIGRLSSAITNTHESRTFFEKIFGSNLRRESVNREILKQGFYKSLFSN